MRLRYSLVIVLIWSFILPLCAQRGDSAGRLFIIGGGKRPPAMMRELVELSGLDRGGYAVILPMSSSQPDTAALYARRSLTGPGIGEERLPSFDFGQAAYPSAWIDSLAGARLIFITGGDQNRFMSVVGEKPEVGEAIRRAFRAGATVAGTSAGAAVMSRLMITGNQRRYPDVGGSFRTIEAGNVELAEGLGLAGGLIVDQHFVWRMRLNRLLSAVLENPGEVGVGIDEATAVVWENGRGRVTGEGQVLVVRAPRGIRQASDGRLGAENLTLSLLLPGDTFSLE